MILSFNVLSIFHLIEFWLCFEKRKTWSSIRLGWSSCPKQFIWYGFYNPSQIFQGFRTEEVYILNLSCVHPHTPTHMYVYCFAYRYYSVFLFRELERVLSAISLKCCLDKVESSWVEYVDLFLTILFKELFFLFVNYLKNIPDFTSHSDGFKIFAFILF